MEVRAGGFVDNLAHAVTHANFRRCRLAIASGLATP
jgi:hypothetical protein